MMGSPTEVILYGVRQLLLNHGGQIKRCAFPHRRLFLAADGKEIYCTDCKKRAEKRRLAKFVDDKGGPEGYAEYRAKLRRERLEGPGRRKLQRREKHRREGEAILQRLAEGLTEGEVASDNEAIDLRLLHPREGED
jgi:hypothetical protein